MPADSGTQARRQAGTNSRVDRLIETGNERLAEHKTISPKEDNALYYFQLAKTLDPGNPEVREGLYQVASHYAVLADRRIRARKAASRSTATLAAMGGAGAGRASSAW